jgi:hypothetical protein
MECDWEIEIASDAPVIDATWEGYVDLRTNPERVTDVAETAQFPALIEALLRLNNASSPVWTAKCDVWPLEVFDPDELDSDRDSSESALGCYIDVLQSDGQVWSTHDAIANWCRRLCLNMRGRPLRDCRADIIVRRACKQGESMGLGITAYLSACGPTPIEAAKALSNALKVLADSILAVDAFDENPSKYNGIIVGE